MLKVILEKTTKRDEVEMRLCDIINKCHINEGKGKICPGMLKEFNFHLFRGDENYSNLRKMFKATYYVLLNGDWSYEPNSIYHTSYEKLTQENIKTFSDLEVVEYYCYAVCGIIKNWINFHKDPSDYKVKTTKGYISAIDFYNANVGTINDICDTFRDFIKEEVKTCKYIEVDIKDPIFDEIIKTSFKIKEI